MMTTNATGTPTPVQHVFETAGLGQAPYKLIGIEKRTYQACYGAAMQPGACCMFCATGIVYLFWLRSADGKKFFVGSDCIYKSGDAGLRRLIEPHVKKHEREQREERENFYITEFTKFVSANNYWQSPELISKPHPNSYYATRLGRTLGDYQKFCYEHSGRAARATMARRILTAAGIIRPTEKRSSKRLDADVLNGAIPEGAVLQSVTLFKIIGEADDENIFTL